MVGNEEIEDRRGSHSTRREDDDEVELIDYLRVLWKYRFRIIGATILSALVVLVMSFLSPPVWEVSMVLEPGRFGSDVFESGDNRPSGKIYFVDTVENLKTKILQASYDAPVRRISGWPLDREIRWNIVATRGSTVLRVLLEVKDRELGVRVLKGLAQSLEEDYGRQIEIFLRAIEQNIVKSREEITKVGGDIAGVKTDRDAELAKLQEEVNRLGGEIGLLKQRELELSQEQAEVRKNTELLMANRNSLIDGGQSRPDPVALVLYTTSLQQNIAYSNLLAGQMNDVRQEIEEKGVAIKKERIEMQHVKEGTSLRIKKLESDIKQIKASLTAYENQKDFARPIEIIQEPTVGPRPVGPKKKSNAAISGFLGLVISVFVAFLVDYISKDRIR